MTDDCGNGFPANSENRYGSTTLLILIVESNSCVYIFSFLFTGEKGKTIMKPVYPLCRKKKIVKSKIDNRFSIFNFELKIKRTNDLRTHFAVKTGSLAFVSLLNIFV